MIPRFWKLNRAIILPRLVNKKEKDNWFVGAVTDENARKAKINFDFLDKGANYQAIIYRDADNADWEKNPEVYTIEKVTINSNSTLTINLAKGGGFAISLFKL